MNSGQFGVSVPDPVQVGSSNSGINANIPDRAELAATTPSVNFKPPFDGGCSSTQYGCCSDGKTPKKDEMGTNCPGYEPLLGDQESVNYQPFVDDKEKAVKSGDEPLPMTTDPVLEPVAGSSDINVDLTPPGGCAGTEYGCCPDGIRAQVDEFGSNCPRSRPRTTGGLSSLLVFRVINQLFPPRDPRPRVRDEDRLGERLVR